MCRARVFRLSVAVSAVLCAALVVCPDNISLATAIWNGATDSDWHTASNWSGPTTGDIVRIAGGANRPVVLSGTDNITLLYCYAAGDTLNIVGGANLTTASSGTSDVNRVGNSGTSVVNQTGGTVLFQRHLAIGDSSSAPGTYNLGGGNVTVSAGYLSLGQRSLGQMNVSGAGTVLTITPNLYLGGFITYAGTGILTQDDGTVNASTIRIGTGNTQTGIYNLNGGTLNLSGNVINTGTSSHGSSTINIDGGTFNLNGATATVNVDTLRIGYQAGNTGALTLAAGRTINVQTLDIGNAGAATGTLTQNGGTVNADTLIMGNLPAGYAPATTPVYKLNGGVLNVANDVVNGAGYSKFIVSGGTLNLTGSATSFAVDLFHIGDGATGSFTLSSGQTLSVGEGFIVGQAHQGDFYQTGGTCTASYLYVANYASPAGTYHLSDGTCTVGTLGIGVRGSAYANISGGQLNASTLRIANWAGLGGSGTVTQTGGTVGVNNIQFGGSGGASTYNLNGGTLNVAGNIVNGGSDGQSTLIIDGGTLNLNGAVSAVAIDRLRIGYAAGRTGSLTLANGDTLTVTTDTRIGGNATAAGTLNIGSGATVNFNCPTAIADGGTAVVNQTGGSVTFGTYANLANWTTGAATYNLSGGTVTTNASYLTLGQRGSATMYVSGTGTLTTNAVLNLGGFVAVSGSGTVTQTGGTVDVNAGMRLGFGAGQTGIYDLHGGTLFANSITTGAGTATFNFDGGTLAADLVAMSLSNTGDGSTYLGGTLSPAGPGTIGTTQFTDSFDYTVDGTASSASLAMDIDAAAGTADKLIVGGTLTLGGALDVTLLAGTPEIGDVFDIMDWGTLVGTFDLINLPTVSGFEWDLSNLYVTGEIGAVPEPATFVLLGFALIPLLCMRRRSGRKC